MTAEIRQVITKNELRQFIHLPAKIHRGHLNWVPPVYIDEWNYFNPKKNRLFDHCDTVLVLAWKNGKAVGRIMGIISHPYNEKHNEKGARFAFMETWNDSDVFHSLIEYVSAWARIKGMETVIGPLGFSDKDPQGFLIEGFDQPVSISSNCNLPYMAELIEREGFQKKVDLVAYRIAVPKEFPSFYKRIAERFYRNNPTFRVLEFSSRRSVKPYIRAVLGLVNETFVAIYGFLPFSEKEMDDFANRYLYLINPGFIKIIMNPEQEVVAFIIGMSDVSDGMRKSKGYLFPFGFYHIFRAGKRSNQLNLLLGAVHPAYQGKGLDVILGTRILESAKKLGKTVIDSHLELEHNWKVRSEMEKMGGKVYKRFRIWKKELNGS